MPFREWNFIFREWNFEFRELLREYPGTLRELRDWPFHSESVFPEIEVVSSPVLPFLGFLGKGLKNDQKIRIFIPTETLKSLEKKGKTFEKQGVLRREKKNKEISQKQGKEGQGGFGKTFQNRKKQQDNPKRCTEKKIIGTSGRRSDCRCSAHLSAP